MLRKGARVHQFGAPILSWGSPARSVPLAGPKTTIGRGADNDVVIADDSVSRRHARIVRGDGGFEVVDLGSTNGTSVRTPGGAERVLRGESATLHDGVTVFFGDVETRFGQPRPTVIGSKTQVRGTEFTRLGGASIGPQEAATAGEPLSARPERRSGWALKQVGGADRRWVLRNTRTGKYLSLDEREVFVWNAIDGERSMRDLLFCYLEEYGELALPRIEAAVRGFADLGLVRGLPDTNPAPTGWRKLAAVLVQNLIRVQLAIRCLDPLLERAYRAWAWRFFTRPAVLALWALALGGLYGFWRAGAHKQLFDLAGAGAVGATITTVGYFAVTAIHEAAHAFAVKSYGRRVNRGGFLLMMGMPFAFVDTSDMWFGTPYSRVVVAMSGPLSTAGIAGGAALTAAYLPQPQIAGVCYTLAYGLYVNTLFNLIPLMPLDGYQAFADALRTPHLRQEAKAYLTRGLWHDLRNGRRPGPKQLGLLGFGLAAMLCLYAMLPLSVVMWRSRLSHALQNIVPQPFGTILVAATIALLIFPVWYPWARKLAALTRRRRAKNRAGVSPTHPDPTRTLGSDHLPVPMTSKE